MDWITTLQAAKIQSLWTCLHDGDLLTAYLDAPAQTLRFNIRVGHLLGGSDLDPTVEFILTIHGLKVNHSARLFPPFAFEEPQNVTREERHRKVEQHLQLWRSQSISWEDLIEDLKVGPLDIMEASLVKSDGLIGLALGGNLTSSRDSGSYCYVYVAGSTLQVERSDGNPFSLDNLVQLGDRYWEEFSLRAQQRRGHSAPTTQAP